MFLHKSGNWYTGNLWKVLEGILEELEVISQSDMELLDKSQHKKLHQDWENLPWGQTSLLLSHYLVILLNLLNVWTSNSS